MRNTQGVEITVRPDGWIDKAGPSVNAVATATHAAAAGTRHLIAAVTWSYSAGPTGATVQIKDGATILAELDVTAAGQGQLIFDPPLAATRENAVSGVLAAGGAGIGGRVAISGYSD